MAVVTRQVEYLHGDTVFEGTLAWDDDREGPRPAVAVSHTWAGRGPFECAKAEALAGLGYVGFALDLYGKGILGGSPEENAALMAPLMENRTLLQARMDAAMEVLKQQPEVDASRVAAIGFCFGGLCVLDLARAGSDVAGVASFHGLFTPPPETGGQISARVLCLHGYDDPMVPPEAVTALAAELTSAGADWQIHAYGHTMHAFTNPAADAPEAGTVYSASADRRSWVVLQDFLHECLA